MDTLSRWYLPSQDGNGLFHCPSSPHISTELPLRYFPGSSQLNVIIWSGTMASSFSGKPLIVMPPTAGGGLQLKAATKNKQSGHCKKKKLNQVRSAQKNTEHWLILDSDDPVRLLKLQLLCLVCKYRQHLLFEQTLYPVLPALSLLLRK